MATRPIFPDTIKTTSIDLDNADGTTVKDLITAATNGSRIDKIAITSDDTVDINLDLYYHNGTAAFQIGTILVPAGAGTATTIPSVSFLNQTTLPFLGSDLALHLEGGKKLQIGAQVALASGKVAHITVFSGDY